MLSAKIYAEDTLNELNGSFANAAIILVSVVVLLGIWISKFTSRRDFSYWLSVIRCYS